MVLKSFQNSTKFRLISDSYISDHSSVPIPPQNSRSMNLTQQHDPTPEGCLAKVEQAVINSKAREIEVNNQLAALLNGFQHLELMLQKLQPPSPSPKTPPIDITPVQSTPIGQPPPLALPSEYDRDRSKGQAFLTSCQTYMLVPRLFSRRTD